MQNIAKAVDFSEKRGLTMTHFILFSSDSKIIYSKLNKNFIGILKLKPIFSTVSDFMECLIF